jgi:biopolymer transport protein ExbB/TolQ
MNSAAESGAVAELEVPSGESSGLPEHSFEQPDPSLDPSLDPGGAASQASGRGTQQRATSDVGPLRSLALALPLYGLLFLSARAMPDSISRLLLERGWIPHVIMVLSCWSLSILLLKAIGLRMQRRAFALQVLPADEPRITPDNVGRIIEHLDGLRSLGPARRLWRSFLIDRVLRIVEHYAARGEVTETATVNSNDAEADAAAVASSFSMVKVLVWAIPILGFIGTVIGIGAAVGGFSESLDGAEQLDSIKSSLGDVTSGLAVAFDTTLVALVASILVMLPTSWIQKAEEQLVSDVDDYCVTNVLRRLVSPGDRGAPESDSIGLAMVGIRTSIVDAIATPLSQMLAANAQLMTRLTDNHEALSGTQVALQDQLTSFTAAVQTLAPNIEQAVAQLDKATSLAEQATTQIGPQVERVVAQLARAETVATVTTEQIGPGVERAAAELAKATSLAEQATGSMGRTQDQLSRELGASRQLLQLLAAGLNASASAETRVPMSARPGNGSNGSSSLKG